MSDIKKFVSIENLGLYDEKIKQHISDELQETAAKHVEKVEGKSLVLDTEITKLSGVSEGANKVEKSDTNGNIKVDGTEVVVYTHPEKHAIADVDGLQNALTSKVAQSTYDVDKAAIDKAIEDETKARTDADADFEARIAVLEGNFGEGDDTVDAKIAAAVKTVQDGVDALTKTHSDDKTELTNAINAKVASVAAGDSSVTIGGTDTAPTVAVKLSADADNALKLTDDGVKVTIPAAAEYSIVKAADSGDFAAVYNLTKDGTIVGASINIPKDLVVKSGSVVGDEIILVLNDDANTEIKIPVGSLIEYVTSGSATGDMVVINVSDDHKVTATITDGTITLAKLDVDTQTKIGKAHSHENASVLDGITAGKVSAWDASEENAKTFAQGLNDAMNTRVETLETWHQNFVECSQEDITALFA